MPGISDLLDSDMEGNDFIDEKSLLSSASETTDIPTAIASNGLAKRSKKRHRVTMPKPKSKITKSSPAPTTKKISKRDTAAKRKALPDALDLDTIGETQQEEAADAGDVEAIGTVTAKSKATAKKTAKRVKSIPEQRLDEGMEVEQTPIVARSNHAQTSKNVPKVVKAPKIPAAKKTKTDTTQNSHTEMAEIVAEMEEEDEIVAEQPPAKRVRTESRTRQEVPGRRRAGSTSDAERGDPNLRRKLGDITRKFENIDMKYKNLKEIGISEANANVEKLRKQCEATTEASNNLISSLKKELAQQAPLVQDARKLKKELHARDDEMATLRASQTELTAALSAAQNEIKTLQAKLAAARAGPVSVEPQAMKPPGSAIKGARPVGLANAEASQAAQMAQMKLDLYGDLTGLIVRSVKRSEDGDTFDCIQTGRNGTLHFKLFIDQEDAKSASFEETEFLYTPLLDQNRDREMIGLMPPYLTEDITFARQNAAKFYQRVVDTLTRRANEA